MGTAPSEVSGGHQLHADQTSRRTDDNPIRAGAETGALAKIRYDPRDLAEIRVYHRDKFLCPAMSPDIASVSVSLQDLQAARNQRRRELRQQLTARRSLVELLTQPHPSAA